VRTVRNYVRSGRLKAVRIGKQYRITRADLDQLTGRAQPGTNPKPACGRYQVEGSSIVQIDGIDPAGADRVSTMLIAATAGPRNSGKPLRVDTVYDVTSARMKIIVLGNLADTAELLRLLDTITGADS
jgi:hypothetical protein